MYIKIFLLDGEMVMLVGFLMNYYGFIVIVVVFFFIFILISDIEYKLYSFCIILLLVGCRFKFRFFIYSVLYWLFVISLLIYFGICFFFGFWIWIVWLMFFLKDIEWDSR